MGLLLTIVVHAASVQDRDGAQSVLSTASWTQRDLLTVRADGGYAGKLIAWCQSACGWTLEVIRRPKDQRGFVLLPKRCVVERTFAWLNKYRRLSKSYEYRTDSEEAFIHLASINLMLRRFTQ